MQFRHDCFVAEVLVGDDTCTEEPLWSVLGGVLVLGGGPVPTDDEGKKRLLCFPFQNLLH